jgi:antitoxin VapB
MAINIKDPETDRVLRELAKETGESITVAARVAAEERLSRCERRAAGTTGARRSRTASGRSSRRGAVEVPDDRPVDVILGHDDNGLPS